ncbi:MAG: MFS transporter [Candidatus Thorarchaeota archaeon]
MLRRSISDISKYTKGTLEFFGQPITYILRQQQLLLLLAVAVTESAFSSSAITLNFYFITLLKNGQSTSFEFPVVLTIYYLVSLSTSSYFGSLSDILGRRRLLIIGTAAAAISFVPFPLLFVNYADSQWNFLILAFSHGLKGLAAAMMAGPVLAMFADIAPAKNHGETMGKFYLAKSAGAASGFLLGSFAWGLFGENAFFFFMIIMLAATALYLFRFKEPRQTETKGMGDAIAESGGINPFTTVLQSLQNKQFQKFAIAWLAYSTLTGAATNYLLPAVLLEGYIDYSSELGVLFLVGAGIMGLAQPTIGRLSDRIGRKPFLVLGVVGMSLLVVMLSAILKLPPQEVIDIVYHPIDIFTSKSLEFVPGFPIGIPPPIIILSLVVFLLSAACFASSSLGLITDVTEEGARGREMGLTQAITSSGSILGTVVGGVFWGFQGILGVLTFCFGLSMIAVIIIMLFLYETSGFYHFAHKLT